MQAKKDRRINRLVSGKNFMDVGDAWGTKNENDSRALKAGAARAAMADITPPGQQLWCDFDAHCQRMQVSGYERL